MQPWHVNVIVRSTGFYLLLRSLTQVLLYLLLLILRHRSLKTTSFRTALYLLHAPLCERTRLPNNLVCGPPPVPPLCTPHLEAGCLFFFFDGIWSIFIKFMSPTFRPPLPPPQHPLRECMLVCIYKNMVLTHKQRLRIDIVFEKKNKNHR